jgi:primosomal protein N' (replication factor Y)
MKKKYLVDVIIPLPLNNYYTYSIHSKIDIGTIIKVPFGNNNESINAISISECYEKKISFPVKNILSIDQRLFSNKQIKFFKWVSQYYMVELPKVFNTLFPKHIFSITSKELSSDFVSNKGEFKSNIVVDESPNFISFLNKEIKSQNRNNYQILILTPNILKSYEIKNKLNYKCHLYDSSRSDKEIREIWDSVNNHQNIIVVGVKSALFLPFSNLSCIYVLDENDISYKESDKVIRFNTRDSAVMLSKIHNCNINLLCNFPSIDSTNNIIDKKYKLVNNSKPNKLKLDNRIRVINILESRIKEKYDGILSDEIKKEILNRVKKNRKTLIYSPFTSTIADIKTSLLKSGKRLLVKEIIKKNLVSKSKIERLIKNINNYDILIGNQSILCNTLFDKFDLLVLIEPERIRLKANYKSNEIIFNLLYKSINHLRYKDSIQVIIQTNESQNTILQNALKLDYKSFIRGELKERKIFKFPPYSKVIKVELNSSNEENNTKLGTSLFKDLVKEFNYLEISDIGTSSDRKKYDIIIKFTEIKNLKLKKERLYEFLKKIKKNKKFNDILLNIDIDP